MRAVGGGVIGLGRGSTATASGGAGTGRWPQVEKIFAIPFTVKVCASALDSRWQRGEFDSEALELIAAFVILHTIQF